MLKIKPEHLEHIRKAITPLDTPERRADYVAGRFPRADKVKDLQKRYRWDLFHMAGLSNPSPPNGSSFICEHLYPYINDTHIDSALKSIVKPLPVVSHTGILA